MVSSVSGGSLTNAHAGWLATPYDAVSANDYDSAAKAFADRLTGNPGAFNLALKATVLAGAVGWLSVGFGWLPGVLGAVALALLAAIFGVAKSGVCCSTGSRSGCTSAGCSR